MTGLHTIPRGVSLRFFSIPCSLSAAHYAYHPPHAPHGSSLSKLAALLASHAVAFAFAGPIASPYLVFRPTHTQSVKTQKTFLANMSPSLLPQHLVQHEGRILRRFRRKVVSYRRLFSTASQARQFCHPSPLPRLWRPKGTPNQGLLFVIFPPISPQNRSHLALPKHQNHT